MSGLRRWAIRIGTALGITLGLGVVALVSSTVPAMTILSTNVHGLSLADYGVTPLRHFAPLSNRVIQDVQQDRATGGPRPTASATPGPGPSPTPSATSGPSPVTTGTPSALPSVGPTAPLPLPTLPPLPTPTVPPLPTPTPTVPPLPTPTLPPPPPLP